MFYEAIKSHLKEAPRHQLKRGQLIYNEGDEPKYIYFVEFGLVGLFHISESGKETFFRAFGNQTFFGHRSYFAKETYHASTMALADTQLIYISSQDCEKWCAENPLLIREIAEKMARELGEAELRIAGLQDKTAYRRIAEALSFLKSRYPQQIWTRKEIAEYAGSTLETVTRVMSQLEQVGLIEKKGRDFEILDFQKLLCLDGVDCP